MALYNLLVVATHLKEKVWHKYKEFYTSKRNETRKTKDFKWFVKSLWKGNTA